MDREANQQGVGEVIMDHQRMNFIPRIVELKGAVYFSQGHGKFDHVSTSCSSCYLM